MRFIGNILWFIFGGIISGCGWIIAGCLWCITIIGIPIGLQCFKFASLAFFSFWKGSYLRRRSRFFDCKYIMADTQWHSNGGRVYMLGSYTVYNNYRYSIRKANV